MTLLTIEIGAVSARTGWFRGLWDYYRGYTHSAVHAASAAALTAFGLLIYIDQLFVVVAIASYICPPIVLYTLGVDVGRDSNSSGDPTPPEGGTVRADSGTNANDSSDIDSDTDGDDGDSDSDGADTDSDGDDSDADADGADADADGADADADG